MESPTPSLNQIRVHVFVAGKVQGVGYRYSTRSRAKELGLSGWVRNLPDSRVEAVFEGAQDVVKQMISWCHSGPPGAVVENVVVEYEKLEGLPEFEVKF